MGGDHQKEKDRITRIRQQGVFFIPSGATLDENHLAGFLDPLSRRTVCDDLLGNGLPCVRIKRTYLIAADDLAEWVKDHAKPLNQEPRVCAANRQCKQ